MSNEVVTFGCRLNIYESEVIKDRLKEADLQDAIIFNSCAVTKEAEKQLRQSIRKKKRENPQKKIIVTGCAAQIDPSKYSKMEEVDLVLGNKEKLETSSYNDTESSIIVDDIMRLQDAASHLVSSFEGKARAFIEIQNGCNHRCTYCIIPYGRGNNRSVPIGEIVKSCNELLNKGYKEIVFTGVDITDYGANLPGKPKLGQLVKRVLNLCKGLERIRLSSIDVAEIDDELMELMKFEERLMPHFHLSLQSGDNMILKRMKRRHTREEVFDFCNEIRKYRPNAAFGADIITGFPTESDEMFVNSYNLVKELKIPMLHVFPYSEREGTPAAKIPASKHVDPRVRKDRAKLLRELGEENMIQYKKSLIGIKLKALVESENTICCNEYLKLSNPTNRDAGEMINVMLNNELEVCEVK